jgi:1-phosphatidylinositol phosphodiesterase
MYNKDAPAFFANGCCRRAISLFLRTFSLAILFIILFKPFDMKLPKTLFALPTLVLPTIAGSYDGYHSPYSFNVNYAHNPAWMSAFPNSTSLTTLSIPGTHDTMTSSPTLGPIYQCQNHLLGTQLEAGIRYIDIRGTVVNNEILIHHEDEYTGFTYTYVLETLFSFLTNNPSEMILMRLKEESTAINSTMSFEEAFNYYRLNDSETAPGCASHFWTPASPGPTTVPTLGELRSKILIIQNFGPVPAPYGIKYESPLFVIEDDYALTDLGDMDSKFSLIEENLLAAANSSAWNGGLGDGLVYLTHVSASVGVLPIDVAAGPLNKSVAGQNDRTGTWLSDHIDGNGTTGVVILDFPGKNLIEEILARN